MCVFQRGANHNASAIEKSIIGVKRIQLFGRVTIPDTGNWLGVTETVTVADFCLGEQAISFTSRSFDHTLRTTCEEGRTTLGSNRTTLAGLRTPQTNLRMQIQPPNWLSKSDRPEVEPGSWPAVEWSPASPHGQPEMVHEALAHVAAITCFGPTLRRRVGRIEESKVVGAREVKPQ